MDSRIGALTGSTPELGNAVESWTMQKVTSDTPSNSDGLGIGMTGEQEVRDSIKLNLIHLLHTSYFPCSSTDLGSQRVCTPHLLKFKVDQKRQHGCCATYEIGGLARSWNAG